MYNAYHTVMDILDNVSCYCSSSLKQWGHKKRETPPKFDNQWSLKLYNYSEENIFVGIKYYWLKDARCYINATLDKTKDPGYKNRGLKTTRFSEYLNDADCSYVLLQQMQAICSFAFCIIVLVGTWIFLYENKLSVTENPLIHALRK